MIEETWPDLPYDSWTDTRDTLHLWTQVVGKIAVSHGPPLNHSWGSAFRVTPRGFATRTLYEGVRSFSLEFDFIDQRLTLHTSDGRTAALPLSAMSVSDFYAAVVAMCAEAGIAARVWSTPVEIDAPIPFEQDTVHHTYDGSCAELFWRILVQVDRVFNQHRGRFIGKSSPVHLFWGALDLAVTRFSGRPAPPREGPMFMREAYSHEVISHGFWPGGNALPEPVFYAYAVPPPDGFSSALVSPPAAYYHSTLGEFVLPYAAVRTARDPDAMIVGFLDSTYDQAATLAHWDRAALEPEPLAPRPVNA
ncbi:MAG TPA: DUF5996 family protein [Vicinamibacterales bacterium]|nr:DUF5996 family protein [Vicinamibacterales bacterium]